MQFVAVAMLPQAMAVQSEVLAGKSKSVADQSEALPVQSMTVFVSQTLSISITTCSLWLFMHSFMLWL